MDLLIGYIFILFILALLIVTLPGWVWFVLLLFVVGMFFFGDKNEK
jgi:hypothetical protein